MKQIGFFNRRLEFAIILISILSYLGVMSLQMKAKKFGDMDFHIETKVVARYLHGAESFDALSVTKAPGPVLYYLIPYYLAGPTAEDHIYWVFGMVWTAAIMTITLVALYKAYGSKFGIKVAKVFVLLVFIIPLHVYYSMGILAESLAFLGVCWLILGLLQQVPGTKFYILYAFGIVALVLARPNAGLVIPLTIACGLYFYWKFNDKKGKALIFASLGALVMIIAVIVVVRMLPNRRATLNQEEYLSFVMHHGRFQFRTEPFDWRFWDNKTRSDSKDYQAWIESTSKLNEQVKMKSMSYDKVYFGWVLQDVLEHPIMLARQFLVRLIFGNTLQVSSVTVSEFTILGLKGPLVYWTFHVTINLINYSIIGFALYYLFRANIWKEVWPLLAVVLALWIFHGSIYMEQRYLFPLRPIILLFGSLGFVLWIKGLRE